LRGGAAKRFMGAGACGGVSRALSCAGRALVGAGRGGAGAAASVGAGGALRAPGGARGYSGDGGDGGGAGDGALCQRDAAPFGGAGDPSGAWGADWGRAGLYGQWHAGAGAQGAHAAG